jgi:tryptophanyl-tRNA synthetase
MSSLKKSARKRVLTGIKPTGDLHLGNYAGAILPCINFSKDPQTEVLLFCADWHGLTDRSKMLEPGQSSLPLFATLLALGFHCEGNSLFLQSDFPEISEIAWYLGCASPVGLLERAHAYKDALASGKKPTCGLFNYPILMAADILTFDSEYVPVGKDQAQHLEYMSDMAKLFNNAVGKEVFKEAKPLIQDTPLLIGIDGEKKMSKSYDNHIPLFGDKKEIEKKIKAIKTDSKGLDEVKDPDTCAVFQILKSFGSEEAIKDMEAKLKQGKGYGYGHAKMDLIAEHNRFFGSKREAYEHYINHPEEVEALVKPGLARAKEYASEVRNRARAALGLLSLQKN